MLNLRDNLWAGTEAALDYAWQIDARLSGGEKAGPVEEDQPFYNMDGIAVVGIKGPLVNIDSPWAKVFGLSTYPDIRRSVIAAAMDPTVSQILLDIDSGGGAVAGCDDTATLIAKINSKVKPVVTFAGGTMASAAYWLGCSASKVYAGKTAIVGSIGVIAVHMDYSESLAKDGIKPTIIRAGKYKALGSPMEKLTPEAKQQIQDRIDSAYKIFVEHVADSRGVSYVVADKKMADGQEFLGEEAKIAGLIDDVSTLDDVMSKLLAKKKPVDTRSRIYDNGINKKRSASMPQPAALTDVQIAALAAGASPEAAALLAEASDPVVAPVADVTPAPAADVAPAPAADVTPAPAPAPAPAVVGDLVAYLQAEVKTKDAALLASGIALTAAQAALATAQTTHTALLDIARGSVSKMQVALGGTAVDLSATDAVAVLDMHKAVSATFSEKFKVGGVAVTAPTAERKAEAAPATPLQDARLKAVRFPGQPK